ncbi:MAG TPA: HAMP domain-containing sensor histidine kinase [Nitrososphaeraceae archaeon]|nr:HAMP domain-containing sensor histidine kinase [Nitrososphaeraceae archaeon]
MGAPAYINNSTKGGNMVGKTDVIQDPLAVQTLLTNMVKSAKHEILLLIPTVNAFLREQHIGIIQLLKQASVERSLTVKILVPNDPVIKKNLESKEEELDIRNDFSFRSTNVQHGEPSVSTITILVIDKKESLVFEKKDDNAEKFTDALGLGTYSNSKPTVISYASIFESLWKQVELYEQQRVLNELQSDFINIASHEMKTPTQSILGYAELLEGCYEGRAEVDAIRRNAERLHKLATNLLDVTRIDSQNLRLRKEKINLNEKILNVKRDIENQFLKNHALIIQFLEPTQKDPIYVEADKIRIYEVISNLLINAIKFTQKGTISISADMVRSNIRDEVVIRIRDTGVGIHPEIFPKLFTKFTTRSDKGIGLGLYICKGIVEAHGSKIWAENNSDGKGATFSFTLPLSS